MNRSLNSVGSAVVITDTIIKKMNVMHPSDRLVSHLPVDIDNNLMVQLITIGDSFNWRKLFAGRIYSVGEFNYNNYPN